MKKIIRALFFWIKRRVDSFYDKHPHFILEYRINRFLANRMNKKNHNGVIFRDDLNSNFEKFMTEQEISNKSYTDKITRDIVMCYILYGITPDEYFMHDFRSKPEEYRSTILSRMRKDQLCCNYLGAETSKYFNQLKDKWTFYNLTKPFFKRDVVRVQEESDWLSFETFCKEHPCFIAKPRLSSSGIGVHIVDLREDKWGGVRGLFEHYKSLDNGKWIFEELIVQDEQMAAWHPSSVNTIRVPSFRTKDGFKILLPLFRVGKNGNLVDNCHNDGGLMSVPDAETGIIITEGYDIYTNSVAVHPNSGIKFKGWQIPKWNELVATTAAVHKTLPPKHRYVGFDFALTKEGWVLVEGNWGNFPHQVCVGYGIRHEFEQLMKG